MKIRITDRIGDNRRRWEVTDIGRAALGQLIREVTPLLVKRVKD